MLIEFRVKNFRSIRDDITLSMVANRSDDLRKTNVMESNMVGVPDLVRSAALFGPNGAGKTSLIRAMQFMREFVCNSASGSKPGEEIPIIPFFLDDESNEAASEFEVIFVTNGVRYQYGFASTYERVVDEWLYAAPEGRNQTWFERNFDEKIDDYVWKLGSYLKGQKQSIQTSTRPNALYLSTGAQLNNPQLQVVWKWFSDTLKAFAGEAPISEGYTSKICAEDSDKCKRVVEFLRNAAISVEGIELEEPQKQDETSPASKSAEIADLRTNEKVNQEPEPYFTHRIPGTKKTVDFPLRLESAGTRYVYAWAGPWIDVLDRGLVLVLDELDSSLHTHLAQYLISLFHDSATNRKGAQLVFTSHSTPIMGNRSLLRRDQVWFVYKDRYEGTQLAAFIDFKPRKGEDREKNYLRGRYGAIPQLPEVG